MTTEDGTLCLDWTVVGMHRQCATVNGIAGTFQSSPNWALQAEGVLEWTNPSCRMHRVLANLDIPHVTIKVGGGNAWQVRGYIDFTINGGVPAIDTTREPEMQWSANWYGAMPAGTDQEQRAPGSAGREFLLQPGDTLTVAFRFLARTINYVNHPVNFLQIANYNASLAGWPAKTTAGSGLTC